MSARVGPRRADAVVLLALLAALVPAGSAVAQGSLRVDASVEYTSGDYGGTTDYNDIYVPLTLTYALRRVDLRLTVPYLEAETSAGSTASGLGDVIAGITIYDLWRSADGSMALDLTGKIKFGTADETEGLGSGENDYSLQTGLYKALPNGNGLSTGVGYRTRGDTAVIDLENVWFAYIGGLHAFSYRMRGGIFFDYREASIAGNEAVQELSAFISRRMDNRWAVQVFLLKGLSDTSPDWGGGFSVGSRF
ncbi:MAG: transporter [Woeseiaceae bacterium]|nr:transporter [Woeseiaceae bacterium]